jgi:hypothetical protein
LASAATYAATLCEEVRFPCSWHTPPVERDEAAYRTQTAMEPSLAVPFDPGTLVRTDLMRLCRRWPTASPPPPPEPGPMPDVPVLVLAGPETVRSSLETARRTAARFPHAKLLETPGLLPFLGFRLNACASRAALRFLNGERVQDRCPRGLLGIGPGEFDAGVRAGGLRGGRFAITEKLFRLDRFEFVPGVEPGAP